MSRPTRSLAAAPNRYFESFPHHVIYPRVFVNDTPKARAEYGLPPA